MKNRLLIVLLVFIGSSAYSQQNHTMEFIYVGTQNYPVGTIAISVEKLVRPHAKSTDTVFGRSKMTDLKTFEAMREFVKSNKRYGLSQKESESGVDQFIIEDSDGYRLSISTLSYKNFLNDLRSLLVRKKLDDTVMDVLEYR